MNKPVVPDSASSIELASRLRSFHEQNVKYLESEIASLEYALKQYLPDWSYEQTELVKEFLSKTEQHNKLIKEHLFLTAYLKALETRQDLTEEDIQQIRIDISLEIEEQASQRIKENFDTPELHEVGEMQKSIKPLYRNISKLIHPDLAQDQNQISLREKAFQTLSAAYFSEDPSAVVMIPSKYLKTALITLIGLTKADKMTLTEAESTIITKTLHSIEAKDYSTEVMINITAGLQLLSQSNNLNLAKGLEDSLIRILSNQKSNIGDKTLEELETYISELNIKKREIEEEIELVQSGIFEMKDETQEQGILIEIAKVDSEINRLQAANLLLLEMHDETKKDKVKSMSRQFDTQENEANQDLSDSSAMTLRPTESLANTPEVYNFERMPESLEEVQKCLIKLQTIIENSNACVEYKDLGGGYSYYLVKNYTGGASLNYVRDDLGVLYDFHFQYREFGSELIKTAINSTDSFYSNKPISVYNIGVITKDSSLSEESIFIYTEGKKSYYAQDGKLDIDKANVAAQIAYDQLAGYLEQFDILAPGYKGKDTSSSESVAINAVKPGSAIEQKGVELKTMEDIMGHISKIMDKLNDDPRFEKSTYETESHQVNTYSYETEDKDYCVTCSQDGLLSLTVTDGNFVELDRITFSDKNFSISLEHKIQTISNSNRAVTFYSNFTPKEEFDKLAMEAYADIQVILKDQLGIELD